MTLFPIGSVMGQRWSFCVNDRIFGELPKTHHYIVWTPDQPHLIDGEERNYGSCDFEIDTGERVAEPKIDVRGDIARVYFYMRDTYDLKYPDALSERLAAWDKADPISDEEKLRNQRIQEAQGSSNPLLEE